MIAQQARSSTCKCDTCTQQFPIVVELMNGKSLCGVSFEPLVGDEGEPQWWRLRSCNDCKSLVDVPEHAIAVLRVQREYL